MRKTKKANEKPLIQKSKHDRPKHIIYLPLDLFCQIRESHISQLQQILQNHTFKIPVKNTKQMLEMESSFEQELLDYHLCYNMDYSFTSQHSQQVFNDARALRLYETLIRDQVYRIDYKTCELQFLVAIEFNSDSVHFHILETPRLGENPIFLDFVFERYDFTIQDVQLTSDYDLFIELVDGRSNSRFCDAPESIHLTLEKPAYMTIQISHLLGGSKNSILWKIWNFEMKGKLWNPSRRRRKHPRKTCRKCLACRSMK